jgi:GT2 family glycosyltransferase
VAAATGEILAFIDADCIADPGWIAAIHTAFADPGAEILGGDVRIAYADPDNLTLLEAYESIYAYRMDLYIRRDGFTGTGNLAVRRAVLDAVGPFRGLEVAEDRDWGQRATRAGHDLRYVPGMKVYHPARASFAELARKWDRHTAHDHAAFLSRPAGRLRWGLRTAAMAASPLAEIPRILRSDRVHGARTRWRALLGVARIRLYRARVMTRLLLGGDPDRLTGAWNR